jgi:hypothetical protein
LCSHHAKISIYSKPGGLFISSGKNSLYRGKNYLYRGIPFELAVRIGFGLKFEFERYLAVTAVYRGKYRYRRVPVFSQRSVKKTLVQRQQQASRDTSGTAAEGLCPRCSHSPTPHLSSAVRQLISSPNFTCGLFP